MAGVGPEQILSLITGVFFGSQLTTKCPPCPPCPDLSCHNTVYLWLPAFAFGALGLLLGASLWHRFGRQFERQGVREAAVAEAPHEDAPSDSVAPLAELPAREEAIAEMPELAPLSREPQIEADAAGMDYAGAVAEAAVEPVIREQEQQEPARADAAVQAQISATK